MKFEKVNPATGAAAPGFSRGSDKYSKNQWSGHSNDGREVNFGRGPTKGNTDNTAHEGKRPQAAVLSVLPFVGPRPKLTSRPSLLCPLH